MSKTIQEKMHEQHRQWQNDHESWRIDIDEWRKELRKTQVVLKDVEEMLRDSLDALEAHADTVWSKEQRLHAHELDLRNEIMAGARKKTDKQWAAAHHRQAVQHTTLSDAHARIKKYHHTVVAEVMRLTNKMRGAM